MSKRILYRIELNKTKNHSRLRSRDDNTADVTDKKINFARSSIEGETELLLPAEGRSQCISGKAKG